MSLNWKYMNLYIMIRADYRNIYDLPMHGNALNVTTCIDFNN